MAMHRSAYAVHGMGLASLLLPATHTRARSVDKVKGATAMRYNPPAGVVSAVTRRRMEPGMKFRIVMIRR